MLSFPFSLYLSSSFGRSQIHNRHPNLGIGSTEVKTNSYWNLSLYLIHTYDTSKKRTFVCESNDDLLHLIATDFESFSFFPFCVYDFFEAILLALAIRYTHTFTQTINMFPNNAECVMRKEEFIIIYMIILFIRKREIWINRDTFVRPNTWKKYNTSKRFLCFIVSYLHCEQMCNKI